MRPYNPARGYMVSITYLWGFLNLPQNPKFSEGLVKKKKKKKELFNAVFKRAHS